MMSAPATVLVVGASAGGLATVEALRRKGFPGAITVLGAEPHLPYDRPPLSKEVLSGAWEPDRTLLRNHDVLSTLDARFILGDPAAGLEVASRTVRTESGRELSAEAIVIATGLSPRTFPGQDDLAGAYVLRTLDDVRALRDELAPGKRVVVVGDGVLGAEIAATAQTMGFDTTLAGPQDAPLAMQFGPLVSGMLAELHTERGVRLRLGVGVTGLVGERGRVAGVALADGAVLPAEVVVVAIGATPATGWLADSGLRLENGVVCDAHCRAAAGIYAVGDVARWRHGRLNTLLRLENRTNATEQAGAVAANILGADTPYEPVPYMWTDQFDARIQVHGLLSADAEVTIVDGDPADRRFVARFHKEGTVVGVLGWNMPKQARLRRPEISLASGRDDT